MIRAFLEYFNQSVFFVYEYFLYCRTLIHIRGCCWNEKWSMFWYGEANWNLDYVKIHIDLLSTSLKCGYVKSYWIYNRQLNTKQNFHPIWAVSKLEKLCHSNAIVKYFAILNSTLEYWIKTPPAIWTSGLLNFPE